MEKAALGFEEVRDSLIALLDAPLEGADSETFLAHGWMVEQFGRISDGARVRFAGEAAFKSRSELGEEGLSLAENYKSPAHLVSAVTGVSKREAQKRMALGLRLRRAEQLGGMPGAEPFPLVSAALADGKLPLESAATITKVCSELRARGVAHESVADAERVLTVIGQNPLHNADNVEAAAARTRAYLDPDGAEPRRETQDRRRSLSVIPATDGMYRVSGLLTPQQAAMWVNATSALISPRTGPRFTSDQERVEDAVLSDDRTRPQKMADAVTELITRAAGAPDMPKLAGATTTVTVQISLDDYESGRAIGWIDGITEPVAPSVVEQMRCHSPIVPIVLGDNGRVLHLGKTKRLFSPSQLKALAARDGGCVVQGCDAPPSDCEAHHVEPWKSPDYAPGRTDVDNGVLLCRFHHARLHQAKWSITMIDGAPHIVPASYIDPGRTPIPTTKRRTGVGLPPGSIPLRAAPEYMPWLPERLTVAPPGESVA